MSFLYSSVGAVLTRYEVDVAGATLTRREAVSLPDNVQYVWPHPTRRFLYVASSNRGPDSPAGRHFLSAFRMDPATGLLEPLGRTVTLRSRPVHMSLDRSGSYALLAYTIPAALTVHRIEGDGSLGEEVRQPALDTGIFAHQILATPSNRQVIMVTRGNDAAGGKPEDPGALKVYDFSDGVLANRASVAPGGGYGFGPRHLDFHPAKPWVYVSIERQNQIQLYHLREDGLSTAPVFTKNTLADPGTRRPRQLGGAIHVHPGGRFVYTSNRSDHTVEHGGGAVFGGGENSIAVFAIDQTSGEPALVQHADPHSYHVRTFTLDPSGRLLVAASIMPMDVLEGGAVRRVPAALSVFRIGDDGRLDFVRKYDVDTNGKAQWWVGMV